MNATKQLINLAGLLVVAVLVVAGLTLIAMPLYTQSKAIDTDTATVAGSNRVYETRIAKLTEAQGRVDEIDDDLDALRRQIAAEPQLDDVHNLISAAAEAADLRIDVVEAGEVEAWVARGSHEEGAGAAAVPVEPVPTAADAGDDEAEEPAAPVPTTQDAPQKQVLLTVTLDTTKPFSILESGAGDAVADETEFDTDALDDLARRVALFMDRLAVGPRLVSVIDTDYGDDMLVVSLLTYIRTEGA